MKTHRPQTDLDSKHQTNQLLNLLYMPICHLQVQCIQKAKTVISTLTIDQTFFDVDYSIGFKNKVMH